jgi:Bifunctional DNA primase/polymerase, N-terminal
MGGLTLDAALRLASAGLPVFPCNGKVPLTDHGFKDATRDETVIRLRWAEAPDANIGVATGAAMNGSKLIVLDVDGSEGEASLAALQSLHGEIPPTVGTRTPRGGRHLWMLAPSDVRIRCSAGKKLGPGLDVRGEGGYVIVPPSSGYSWEGTRSPATMPDWLVGLLREPDRPPRPVVEPRVLEDGDGTPYGLRALEEETERVRSAPEGQRNTQLNESAFRLGQLEAGGELSPGVAEDALQAAGLASGLSLHEVDKTIASGP